MIDAAVIAWVETFVALLIVTAPKRVVPPAAELSVIFPVPAVMVKPPGPLTVLENKILPIPAPVFKTVVPLKVTADPN